MSLDSRLPKARGVGVGALWCCCRRRRRRSLSKSLRTTVYHMQGLAHALRPRPSAVCEGNGLVFAFFCLWWWCCFSSCFFSVFDSTFCILARGAQPAVVRVRKRERKKGCPCPFRRRLSILSLSLSLSLFSPPPLLNSPAFIYIPPFPPILIEAGLSKSLAYSKRDATMRQGGSLLGRACHSSFSSCQGGGLNTCIYIIGLTHSILHIIG